jgi:hypothetical protein
LEFEKLYQGWYSEACEVIRQILPNRLSEFEELYQGNDKRKDINGVTYTIRDWLLGTRASIEIGFGTRSFKDFERMASRFDMQRDILISAKRRFESSLFDIKQIIRADLFDSEIEVARELLKNGFLRPAGAVAGVVLETHLQEVCHNHSINIKKKNPTIGDLYDPLKENDVIDVLTWRFIQRLGDLRNLCDHKKDREPTDVEVRELIDGTEKITKTIL